ncbi:hypothetical protein GCM10022380_54180 [Amycolatopsis tucumanensis]|uniref:Uncharacterized protein n=1 Tax=Amycolatopsis tucumanensis TaxID=401106 RepID=A0ABP7IWF3_9PSEU
MNGAMNPDSTPSPTMNSNKPTYPRNNGAGSPHLARSPPNPLSGWDNLDVAVCVITPP